METLSRSDQAVLAAATVVVCLVVALSLRGTRPGAPARIGAIVAGIAVILTLAVGMRANDLTNPRSDDAQTLPPLHPTETSAYGDATLDGDPQSGLTVHPPADGTTGGAYLPDAKFCDGRLEAGVHLDTSGTTDAIAAADNTTGAPATAGLTLGLRATDDPDAPAALSVEYVPSEQEVRVLDASGSTLASLTSTATDPVVRVEVHGTKASVWFDGQQLTDDAVPITGDCGAVRFGSWGEDAVLRNLTIRPAS
ncbi:hypothetical protein [Cryptosporangium phraense]|uniref:Uncharacterized protein n=1 Tax=Cryptosporangium phraense TaxID=2593070 RepID=A0A545AM76_9ACTN|nr:hypothetical protein [Cryptosporangium phraense]TQS42413.1 hypothetical protein FL583_24195 [Cryptosporangium phraense]